MTNAGQLEPFPLHVTYPRKTVGKVINAIDIALLMPIDIAAEFDQTGRVHCLGGIEPDSMSMPLHKSLWSQNYAIFQYGRPPPHSSFCAVCYASSHFHHALHYPLGIQLTGSSPSILDQDIMNT